MQIKLLKNIKGGPYIELLIVDQGDGFVHWSKKSKFIEDGVWEIFSDCFKNANKKFNYYGDTKYEKGQLEDLFKLLKINKDRLNDVKSSQELFILITSLTMGKNFITSLEYHKIDWAKQWKILLRQLLEINQGLIEIVHKCIDEKKILWILGV